MAITRTTILVSSLSVKSLQLFWRSGTRRFHLWMPDLQMSCGDLTKMRGYQDSNPRHGHQETSPITLIASTSGRGCATSPLVLSTSAAFPAAAAAGLAFFSGNPAPGTNVLRFLLPNSRANCAPFLPLKSLAAFSLSYIDKYHVLYIINRTAAHTLK